MSRPCVCGGSNENCRYCSGLGEVSDQSRKSLPIHAYSPAFRRPRSVALLTCPQGCGVRINPNNLSRHLRRAHSVKRHITQDATLVANSSKDERKAQDSSLPLREEPVTSPDSLPTGLTSGPPIPAPPPEDNYRTCPACKARLKLQKFAKHLRKVHGFRPNATVSVKRARKTSRGETSNGGSSRKQTTMFLKPENNLDATKLYAHRYRERGRFGSHPSHDSFGDESGPD